MVNNSVTKKQCIFQSRLIDTHLQDIFVYLESACHDEQNGGQSFKIGARIAELWRFKARKMKKLQEEDCLTIFKPGLWQMSFLDAAKNGTIFSRN